MKPNETAVSKSTTKKVYKKRKKARNIKKANFGKGEIATLKKILRKKIKSYTTILNSLE
jgi:hypothetical protein